MDLLRVCNVATGSVLAERAWHAKGPLERMRGLLGRTMEPGQGMVIEPCSSVHTFFMGVPLDLLFVDAEHRVLRAIPNLLPWRLSPLIRGARYVVELPAGAAEGTLAGHCLALEPA
jgi:uncharacterized membrane protein (UPF0127 family)